MYPSADDWRAATSKRVMLFGMSGLGKTHISTMLRDAGNWYHYSVDYRIGTRYMGEHIADECKRAAMQVPLLRDLLMSDSIYIGSNITFHNLAPLSTYLGKPGNPEAGGLLFEEYQRRQTQHRSAETQAMLDTPYFIDRAKRIYGYDHFICDTSGSICEVVDPEDPSDPVLKGLSEHLLYVWIEGSEDHTQELIRRFDRAPKPMYYQPEFLVAAWSDYLTETGDAPNKVDPDAFVRWTYARALAARQPRYRGIAETWGVTVTAEEIAALTTPQDFDHLIARALERRG